MRESLLKLTRIEGEGTILIGVESIINVKRVRLEGYLCTKIESRAAMVSSCWVEETLDEIFNQYKINDTQRQTTS
jgi:hypothetical protein